MGSGLEFFVRAFTYTCAFIGTAWFGYFAYTVGFGLLTATSSWAQAS